MWCGDCLELLPEFEAGAVDAVVTDPPYMIGAKSDGNGKINPWSDWTNAAVFMRAWMGECRRVSSAMWSCMNWRSVVTFQKASCDLSWPIESLLVWNKEWIGPGGTSGLRPSYELVALWCNGRTVADRGLADIQSFPWCSFKPNGHPAEKPVDLLSWCIDSVKAYTVLDPFMGSGTTGVACVKTGRKFYGIEKEPKYFEIAVNRIERAFEDQGLFVPHTPIQNGQSLFAGAPQ
jgi:DNA modification methylase